MSANGSRYQPLRPSPSLRVRAFEFNNARDRAERRERDEHQRARWAMVEPVACPMDGTPLLPGQQCLTCAAHDLYRGGRA